MPIPNNFATLYILMFFVLMLNFIKTTKVEKQQQIEYQFNTHFK